jgi:hypothetical protein
MEKARYEVYIRNKASMYIYVTTTRNTEDMINQICEMHNNSYIKNFIIWRITKSEGRVKVFHSTKKTYPHETNHRKCRTGVFERLHLPD